MNQQELDFRRNGIGGSDAPVIMGVSPWRTVYDLYEDKALGVSKSFDNPATRRGKELEEPARVEFERLMGVTVAPDRKINKDIPWLRASLDGIDIEEKILVEIKCPNKVDHSVALSGKIPEKYVPQCQHYLAVTGLPGMYYFSFDGSKGKVVEVARDQKYIDEMLSKEEIFWNMVLNKIPPERSVKDLGNVPEWTSLAEEWQLVNSDLKNFQAREKAIREQLIGLAGEASAEGGGIKLTKSEVDGAIDYKVAIENYLARMRQLHPGIEFPELELDSYRKESFTKYMLKCI